MRFIEDLESRSTRHSTNRVAPSGSEINARESRKAVRRLIAYDRGRTSRTGFPVSSGLPIRCAAGIRHESAPSFAPRLGALGREDVFFGS